MILLVVEKRCVKRLNKDDSPSEWQNVTDHCSQSVISYNINFGNPPVKRVDYDSISKKVTGRTILPGRDFFHELFKLYRKIYKQ